MGHIMDGLYTNTDLVDTLIVDLNNLVKQQASGQYIQFCGIVVQMAQKLNNLKSGIVSDLANKDEKIEALKNTIRELGGECEDIPINEFLNGGEAK